MKLCEKIGKYGPLLSTEYADYLNKISVKTHVPTIVPDVKIAKLVKVVDHPSLFLPSDIHPDHILKAHRGSGLLLDLATVTEVNTVRKMMTKWADLLIARGIKPNFLIEEKITDTIHGKTGAAVDYKFFCFHGKPQFFLCRDGMSNRNFYYLDYTPIKLSGKKVPPVDLTEMIRISEALSAPFSFVRIDLYNGTEGVYFGEYTFHVNAGKQEFSDAIELKLGALWKD